MTTQTKDSIIREFNDDEITYIDAVCALEDIGYNSKEAEQIVEDAFQVLQQRIKKWGGIK